MHAAMKYYLLERARANSLGQAPNPDCCGGFGGAAAVTTATTTRNHRNNDPWGGVAAPHPPPPETDVTSNLESLLAEACRGLLYSS